MNYPSNRMNVLKYLIFCILIIVNCEHLFVSVVEQETYQMQQLKFLFREGMWGAREVSDV